MGSEPLERIETTDLKDHRPWAERIGAMVLLLALGAGIATALAAERRQRREVCRRAEENLSSITTLLSNRFNIWYTERAQAAAEAASRLAVAPAFAQACREGRGNSELRHEIEYALRMGGFQAGGIALPSGKWMDEAYYGDATLRCESPDLRDPLKKTGAPHGPPDHSHLDLAGPQASTGNGRPQIVFLVDPLPAARNLLAAQLSYSAQFSLILVAREGPGAIVLWANSRSALQRGAHLQPPLPLSTALALDHVVDILQPKEAGEGTLAATSYFAPVRWGIVATIPVEKVIAPIRTTAWLAWGVALLLFALCIATVVGLYRRSYWRTLRESAALSKALVRRLLQAGEGERLNLSHELHDGLIPYLTAARLRHLAVVDGLQLSEDRALASGQAERLLVQANKECRRLIEELRPPILDDGRLLSALEDLATEQGALWTLHSLSEESLKTLNEDVKSLLYRIAQEALANAAKHAIARQVVLSARQEGGEFVLEVRDDGRGFDLNAPQRRAHFGLAVMRERAVLAGARLTLTSAPGAGATIRVSLPLIADPELEERAL